jgi:diamine N-acetyltransferase
MTETISLCEVNQANLRAVLRLDVGPTQGHLVAPNAVSIAEAHFEPRAWFRAVCLGETPVGFVMLYQDTETPEYFLWRLMIDAAHQGRGYGRRAVELLVDYVRTLPRAGELGVSAVPGDGSPIPFYEHLGFVRTGEMLDGEEMLRLDLTAEA